MRRRKKKKEDSPSPSYSTTVSALRAALVGWLVASHRILMHLFSP